MIKTSIIVPVYNTEEYLEETFDSIFNQTQKEIEVIAINDGSTDNSLHLLKEIKRKHPEMILFSQENKGLGAARNKGMELATGEFTYFIDSDDCLVNTAMETCYKYAKENNLDVVMFDAEAFGDIEHVKGVYDRSAVIADQKVVLSGEEFARKYWTNAFYPSACLIYISTCFLKKNNLKFLSEMYYEDNEFHCRMMPAAKYVLYIPQMLYKRRYREKSITSSAFDMRHARDYLHMIEAVDKQEHTQNIKMVIQQVERGFLNVLVFKCRKNGLFEDVQLAKEIFRVALSMFGGAIENIIAYRDIDLLCQISEVVSDEVMSHETKQNIQNQKQSILKRVFCEVPLGSEDAYVGIYGTGRHTERFIYEYQINEGKIRANLIFIDSYAESGEKQYMGYDIFNVNDIVSLPLNCIVVASSKYEQETYQTVKSKYGNKFKIIRLVSDLHF